MGSSVPVRCPACRRDHAYTPPVFPCACGAPLAPPLLRGATPQPITHRTWTDSWVTVRCPSCGRNDQWPQPELGCGCGTVLRIPVRPAPTLPRTGPLLGSALARARPDADPGGGQDTAPPDADDSTTDPGAGSPAEPPTPSGTGSDTGSSKGGGAGSRTDTDRASDADSGTGSRTGTGPGSGTGTGPGSGTGTGPGSRTSTGPGSGTGARPEPDPDAGSAPSPHPLPAPTPHARPPFRPLTIRTARDAVTAAALYLKWLGFRDILQSPEHPASGIDLRARGLVAQVDPRTEPSTVRDVECLWLHGLNSSAVSVFFSLTGYAPEARARAEDLGVPLFVMDLTGTPQPANGAADELLSVGG